MDAMSVDPRKVRKLTEAIAKTLQGLDEPFTNGEFVAALDALKLVAQELAGEKIR